MKNKIEEFGDQKFIKVSKKQYENFIRYFGDKLSSNCFMGWCDSYDWSLSSGKYKIGTIEYDCECEVARNCFETYGHREDYYLRLDYIEKYNYDINTIVPKPRKKRLSKKKTRMKTKEMDKLVEWLTGHNISFTRKRLYDGEQVLFVYKGTKYSCVCHSHSYGGIDGLLELWAYERHIEPTGFFTGKEVIKLVNKEDESE